MSQPQQPKAAPTNNQNSLDEDELIRLASLVGTDARNPEFHLVVYVREVLAAQQAAINKTIMEDALAIVGEDEPETELKPFSDGNGNVGTVLGRNVARNELKAELRQQITKKYGRADNEYNDDEQT